MQQQYCSRCGNALTADSAFCNRCGAPVQPITQTPPPPMPQGQVPPPYGQPPMTPPPYGYQPPITYQQPPKPKVPGRGFGITSMVLGILVTVITFSTLASIIEWFFVTPYDVLNGFMTATESMFSIVSDVCTSGLVSVLALIFSLISRKSGFKCGISLAGFILSIVGLALTLTCVVLLMFL